MLWIVSYKFVKDIFMSLPINELLYFPDLD